MNLSWGDIGLSGKSQGSFTQNPQVFLYIVPNWNYGQKPAKITIFKRLRNIWFGKFLMMWYWTIREVTRVIQAKTPGLYIVQNWSYGQKSQFLRLCVIFGFVNFSWGDIGLSGKSQGSSTWKPQIFIKSQTRVMTKKIKMWLSDIVSHDISHLT